MLPQKDIHLGLFGLDLGLLMGFDLGLLMGFDLFGLCAACGPERLTTDFNFVSQLHLCTNRVK